MNEVFRKKKGPTDVLSFPAQRKPGSVAAGRTRFQAHRTESLREEPWRAGIESSGRISGRYCDRARDGATLRAKEWADASVNNELRVLILHGVLHLLGYDHETDRGEMNRIEHTTAHAVWAGVSILAGFTRWASFFWPLACPFFPT